MHVYLQICCIYLEVELLSHTVALVQLFEGWLDCFPKWFHYFIFIVFYSLQQKWMRAPISPHPHQHLLLSIILIMAFLVYVKVWFAFFWGLWMLGIFLCANWSFVSHLWRNRVLDFFQVFIEFIIILLLFMFCFFFLVKRHVGSYLPDQDSNPHSLFSSVTLMPDSLWSDGLQHTRLPCPSPTPGAYWNSSIELVMPSNHLILCHPLLLPPSIFTSIRVFSNVSVLHIRWPKYWSFSFSISPSNEYSGLISFRMDWLDLLAVQVTLKSLLQYHSSKASILQWLASFIVQLSHPYLTTGKTIALTRWTFFGKVMSLLFNMLSKLVITFLPRSKSLNFMAAVTICSDFGAPQNKVSVSTVSPSICHEVMGPDAMILGFWMLSFKPTFSLSFHFHWGSLVLRFLP